MVRAFVRELRATVGARPDVGAAVTRSRHLFHRSAHSFHA
jgi:hypothetical protein